MLILTGTLLLVYGACSFYAQNVYPLRSELIQTQGKVIKLAPGKRNPCQTVWYSFSAGAEKPLEASADMCEQWGGYAEGDPLDVAYNPNDTGESFILYEGQLYSHYERTKRGSLIVAGIGLLIAATGGYEWFRRKRPSKTN